MIVPGACFIANYCADPYWIAYWAGYTPATKYAVLNANDKSSNLTLSGGDLSATRNTGTGWATVRATVGKSSGKWYFEVENLANGGTTGDAMWGFMSGTDSLTVYPGNSALDANSIGWQANNSPDSSKFQDGSLGAVTGYGTVAVGGKSLFAVDLGAGKLWIKNSSAGGWAGGGDPAAGTTPTFTFSAGAHVYPALSAYSAPQGAKANFGASSFSGSVPSGFNSGWYGPDTFGTLAYSSRITVASTTDIQGVASDGTHLYVTSSTAIYKYTKAGVLVTSRDVSSDAPVGKSQINGAYYKCGILYISAAENSTPQKSYIARYNPASLAYIDSYQITGNWFSEGLAWKDGYWWMVFHTSKVVAKIDPATYGVVATYPLTFAITGTSGGYGTGSGYDGVAWVGDYLLANVHEIYDQDYLDVYYWNGATFDEVQRVPKLTTNGTQGLALDPTEVNVLWIAERNYSGLDSVAKVTITP
jgi:hypothetical protein